MGTPGGVSSWALCPPCSRGTCRCGVSAWSSGPRAASGDSPLPDLSTGAGVLVAENLTPSPMLPPAGSKCPVPPRDPQKASGCAGEESHRKVQGPWVGGPEHLDMGHGAQDGEASSVRLGSGAHCPQPSQSGVPEPPCGQRQSRRGLILVWGLLTVGSGAGSLPQQPGCTQTPVHPCAPAVPCQQPVVWGCVGDAQAHLPMKGPSVWKEAVFLASLLSSSKRPSSVKPLGRWTPATGRQEGAAEGAVGMEGGSPPPPAQEGPGGLGPLSRPSSEAGQGGGRHISLGARSHPFSHQGQGVDRVCS